MALASQPQAAAEGLPEFVGRYHSLVPMQDETAGPGTSPSPVLGVACAAFRGVDCRSGEQVLLRWVSPASVPPSPALLAGAGEALERWRGPASACPFLVPWRDVFVSAELDGAPALWLAHEFCPGAVTLEAALADGAGAARLADPAAVWQVLTQLAAAVQATHGAGLTLWGGGLALSKVLLLPGEGPPRVRVACPGMLDALTPDPAGTAPAAPRAAQQADLAGLGYTVLGLACAAAGVPAAAPPTLDRLAGTGVDPGLVRLVAGLLAAPRGAGLADAAALAAAAAPAALRALGAATQRCGALLGELTREAENGRLLRLLAQLGSIVGRPGLGTDPDWSETGDRYMLKLFNSHLLHQVDATGKPTLDWGVLVECLNKFDAGIPEMIMLLTADEASLLVVTYADLKHCFLRCLDEMAQSSIPEALLEAQAGDEEYTARDAL